MNAKIYHFDTSLEAYNAAQTDEAINDGDVLIIESEKVVGLVGDFPLAITKSLGQLHALTDGDTFAKLGFAPKSIALAIDAAKTLGFPLFVPVPPIGKIEVHDDAPLFGHQDEAETFENVIAARSSAELKAWDSLARYKFEMFGYWASSWVKFNQVLPRRLRLSNPFKRAVVLAREIRDRSEQ